MLNRSHAQPRAHARAARLLVAWCGLALLIGGCVSAPFGSRGGFGNRAGVSPGQNETIGQGEIRVGVMLPRSAAGNAGNTATAYRNAIDLAASDFPSSNVQYVIYDTGGTVEGARAAADQAVADRVQLVLGPLFAANVKAAAPVLRSAGIPVVAFSNDSSAAAPGVYLLSFFPQDNVKTIVSYAASKGRRAFAALLPNDALGTLVEGAFRSAVADAGGRVVAIERYGPKSGEIRAAAASIAARRGSFDALLMPDSGEAVALAAATLASSGVTSRQVLFLGSGQWDGDPAVLNEPALAGAAYAAPPKQGFQSFAERYMAAYGSMPPRIATIGYDAAVLSANLPRFGTQRYDAATLTNSSGFIGTDGVFRLTREGLNERRLAIHELTGSGSRQVVAAPRDFASRGF